MLLVVDTGNTNTVFAVFDRGKLLGKWRMTTDSRRTADEYAIWLIEMMRLSNLTPGQISTAIISCVVPQTLFALRSFVNLYFNTDPLVVGEESVKLNLKVLVDRPEEVGADRLVNAFAAYERHGGNLIILDFGTATTFDVINKKGDYLGGVIAPGINLSLEALHRAAAKLPNVSVARPSKVIGTNTVAAMQSGVFYGYLGLIEGIIARIRKERGVEMRTIATGGLAPLYAAATSAIDTHDADLTIYGLQRIHELNSSATGKKSNVRTLQRR